jgi:hypothetical protein
VGKKKQTVSETTNMHESSDTDQKKILPIVFFFFNKLLKIGLVLVPRSVRWRERPLGTSTKTGQKVLNISYLRTLNSLTE